jgi:hypothetical protein
MSALFRDVTQHMAAVPYRRFGTTYGSDLQGSRNLGFLPRSFENPSVLTRSVHNLKLMRVNFRELSLTLKLLS